MIQAHIPHKPVADLRSKFDRDERDESDNSADSSSFNNLFAHLNVEEPSKSFLNAHALSSEDNIEPPDEEFEVENSEDKLVQLAAYYFINDLIKFRAFIHETWEMIRALATTLEAAAIATNIALGLVRHVSQEFQQAYSRGATADILRGFYSNFCQEKGDDLDDRKQLDDPINFRTNELVKRSFLTVCIIIEKYAASVNVKPSFMPCSSRIFLAHMT
jgi:hypothetical protein